MEKLNVYNTTKKELIEAVIPIATRTYKPISNEELINITLESIYASGFELDKETYTQARNGNVANGKYTISNVKDKDMQLQIAFQNSYDRSLSLKWAIGANVFICSNGCVSGDYGAFKKKHMGEITTFAPATIIENIKHSSDIFEIMCNEKEAMKEIEISKSVRAELIGKMYIENDFIESTQLNIIKRELSKPTHDYKCENSMWELYNFVNFSMKEVHPSLYMRNHINLHKFFQEQSSKLILV